jgi:hypothetical protein
MAGSFESNGLRSETNRMTPESQTLFSITLFLALSSLMAWTNRRNRGTNQIAVSLVRSGESVQLRRSTTV